MNINLNRQKFGLEDLEIGNGVVIQERGGIPTPVTQINTKDLPYDGTSTLGDVVLQVEASRDAAALSAGNALTSETNASASEAAAALSETNASASEAAAALSETNASASEAAAALSASNAALSETNALASADKAEKWAEEAEDVEVETGKYSAKHWAAKAEDWVIGSTIDDITPQIDKSYSGNKVEAELLERDNRLDTAETKLDTIETGATGDQTASEIETLYEGIDNTNKYTDAEKAKVGYITVTQAVDIDSIESKLATIEDNAKDDQLASEVPYDNTTSGMVATNVQAAIDELDAYLGTIYEGL